jgi:tetratricopeptide (TPR) repeat protein
MANDVEITQVEKIDQLKEQGRAYLRSNQADMAIRVFAKVLELDADDLDSLLVLGDSYLLIGDRTASLTFYLQAWRLAPDRRDVQRRVDLALSRNAEEDQAQTEVLPTQPHDLARLYENLVGRRTPVSDDEVEQARILMDEVIHSESPAKTVASKLDAIHELIPALIELNIRQARLDGQPQVADELEGLLLNTLLQKDADQSNQLTKDEFLDDVNITRHDRGKITLAGIDSQESPNRQAFIAECLRQCGYEVMDMNLSSAEDWQKADLMITHNPHGFPSLSKTMAAWTASGKPLIVDLDLDFRQLPVNHPDFEKLGTATPGVSRAYTAALQLANQITLASEPAAEEMAKEGFNVVIIPDGWTSENPLWNKPIPERNGLSIGLMMMQGDVEDATQIRRAVTRVMREFPQVRLAVSGDPQVYQMFDSISATRRFYLPPLDPEDYPYLLSQIDILLAPLNDNPFNHQRSDRRLMEAGVRKIPWVASPLPTFLEWAKGGLIAYSLDDWYTHIRVLVQDANLRESLALAGYEKAQQRELKKTSFAWLRQVQQLLETAKIG